MPRYLCSWSLAGVSPRAPLPLCDFAECLITLKRFMHELNVKTKRVLSYLYLAKMAKVTFDIVKQAARGVYAM